MVRQIRKQFIIHRTGVSTFASRTSPNKGQSLQKSFHLSTADKIELKKISSPSENKKYATAQTNTTQTVVLKLNIDNGLQGGQTEGLLLTRCCRNGGRRAKLNGSISNQLWCLVDSDGILNPPLRQHPNRYVSPY